MRSVVVEGKKYTMKDMKDWYVQIRGFPSVLVFGKGKNEIMGEGQSGGRAVSGIAKEAESRFVEKYGIDGYTEKMDKLMGKKKLNSVA